MALVPCTYTPSKNLYALDFSDVRVQTTPSWSPESSSLTSWEVRAIWTKTTKGVTTLSYGRLHESFRDDQFSQITPELFLKEVDMRYGGTAAVKWDGTFVYAPKLPFVEIQEAVARLDPYLKELPTVPDGFEGWFVSS